MVHMGFVFVVLLNLYGEVMIHQFTFYSACTTFQCSHAHKSSTYNSKLLNHIKRLIIQLKLHLKSGLRKYKELEL